MELVGYFTIALKPLTVRGETVSNTVKKKLMRVSELDEQSQTYTMSAWGFRFLQGLPNVKMVLSGMSNMEQMKDNIRTFSECRLLSAEETAILFHIAEGMKDSVPCTACRYCCDGCPMGLDIPSLLSGYNEVRFSPAVNVAMRIEALPEEKRPSACIGCGKCARICPQNIDIPESMKEFSKTLDKLPSWAEICRQRDEAARNHCL